VKVVRAGRASPRAALERFVRQQEQAIERGELERIDVPAEHRAVCEKFGREFFVVCNAPAISVGLSEEDLMLVALEPELVARKTMIQARQTVALARALAKTAFPGVLLGGGDLAGNDGPMYSPEAFRRVMLPALKFMVDELNRCGVKYVFRSDGDLWPLTDMIFQEAGCHGYGEVDRLCGMTVAAVRRRYPHVSVWNNVPSCELLRRSAAWVREESQRCLAESGGTGYFHGCSNAILPGTPVENVLAMFSV